MARSSSGVSAATNNATVVKATDGEVLGWSISNSTASAKYFKLYNKATAPAPGTDNALLIARIGVPPNGNVSFHVGDQDGFPFPAGISFAIVGVVTDTDNTSVAAGDVIWNLLYE